MNHRTLQSGANPFGAMLAEPGNGLRERAYRYALTLSANEQEADEVAQEALYRALMARCRYNPRLSPEPWLRTIVRNAYLDRLRRGRRTQSLDAMHQDLELSYEPPAREPGPLEQLLARESASLVQEAIGGLRPSHRRAFRLRHLEGLTYEQIAKATRTPLNTVRTRLSRAKEAFRRACGGGNSGS